jgi:hypothetical protein
MTGNGAKDVLGKPLREVFKDKRCKAMSAQVASLACMHGQLTSVSTSCPGKRCHFTLKVSLVGEANEKNSSATHCMVALYPANQGTPNSASQSHVTEIPKSELPSIVVG